MADTYRVDRLGSGYVAHSADASDAYVDYALQKGAEGIGIFAANVLAAGFGGIRAVSRSIRDHRMRSAAEAVETASASRDFEYTLTLAQDFSARYPDFPFGPATEAEALLHLDRYREAATAVNRAMRLGFDEAECHIVGCSLLRLRDGRPRHWSKQTFWSG